MYKFLHTISFKGLSGDMHFLKFFKNLTRRVVLLEYFQHSFNIFSNLK